MKTYEEVADFVKLDEETKKRYTEYMRYRWADEEEMQCQTGYAEEWAFRFMSKQEYSCSDSIGKSVLTELDRMEEGWKKSDETQGR